MSDFTFHRNVYWSCMWLFWVIHITSASQKTCLIRWLSDWSGVSSEKLIGPAKGTHANHYSWRVLHWPFMVEWGHVEGWVWGWFMCTHFSWTMIYKGNIACRCAYARFYKSGVFCLVFWCTPFLAFVSTYTFSLDPTHCYINETPAL